MIIYYDINDFNDMIIVSFYYKNKGEYVLLLDTNPDKNYKSVYEKILDVMQNMGICQMYEGVFEIGRASLRGILDTLAKNGFEIKKKI